MARTLALLVLAVGLLGCGAPQSISSNYTFTLQESLDAGSLSTTNQNNFYGWSLSTDSTFTYMAVGAPLACATGSSCPNFRGLAYVYQRTPSGVISTTTLDWQPSGSSGNTLRNTVNPSDFDFFGQAVWVGYDNVTSGNVLVAVYALRGRIGSGAGNRVGGVYLFGRAHNNNPSTNSWGSTGFAGQGSIQSPSTDPIRFGETLTGDLTRSGGKKPVLIVGAFRYQQKQGRVYVYEYDATFTLAQTIDPEPIYQNPNFGFGISLALDDDNLVIGAAGTDLNRGKVHVYTDDSTSSVTAFTYLKSINSLDGVIGDQYGWSVAIFEEYIIVGANRREDCGEACGAVYVHKQNYSADGDSYNNWGQVAKLSALNLTENSQFGTSVALGGSFAVVGAPETMVNGLSSAGAVYVFQQNTGDSGYFFEDGWGQVGRFFLDAPNAGDSLGRCVAAYAPHLVGSAMLYDSGGIQNAGGAFYWSSNLPLGGVTGNPAVNPNITSNTSTSTTTTTSGRRVVVSGNSESGPAAVLSAALFAALEL